MGRLAAAANVNVQTVRYYERRGLLPRPPRSRSGYRQYPEEAVARLHFIKRAQELGFSLEDIRGLLELRVRRPSEAACAAVETRTRTKIELVERKIRELERVKRGLERLVESCRVRKPTSECPVLETLEIDAEEVARGA
jgi:Hg(II)-responsive transcriptional regulator